ncbi:MAG TPA: hypothetical protein VLF89_04060 [Candidatus Saccharimonadales bacterium]|nr:hypothetical protein [Candidatus Saccharimonadales bacterium]
MVKTKKKKSKKKRSSKYEKKLVINGSFLDVIKVAMDVDKKK